MTSEDNSNQEPETTQTLKDLLQTIWTTMTFPVHPAGWPFILAFFAVTFLLSLASPILGIFGGILSFWCIYFFRNPIRHVPTKEGLIISPADGLVSQVRKNVSLPVELDAPDADADYTQVSVFLNVFNVHVNRVPFAGKVKQVIYHPGKFLNAALDKASDENERSTTLIETKDGTLYAFVQIAGFVARRILNDLKEGDEMKTGQHMGIIRFGSRVDIYLPKGANPLVSVGQTMIGGETVIADFKSREKARDSVAI
ncbi:MAG: phosphatidylserine decarboxylase [Alphaproteobacteria bacterium]|nr:phosphatidylserine decarboxylase [Alphaproteobacteria bacterium]